jgi:CRISPR-associated protein Csd2
MEQGLLFDGLPADETQNTTAKPRENAIQNRYEFVILYDVENGNPNGDPDAGNMPRTDPETGHGIVTDVCIKRKIRNYTEEIKGENADGYRIYIKQNVPLNRSDDEGVQSVKGITDKGNKSLGFRDYMCKNFFDIRTFGAVMTTAAKDTTLNNTAGQVRGPVQITFGKSIDPIAPQEITITRVAITTEEKAKDNTNEMGRKSIVPYALYRQEGFVSANLAEKVTGFSETDLEFLWEAILNMFETDRSAARGKMVLRDLVIFRHDGKNGNAPSHKLFDLVKVTRKDGVSVSRKYGDYTVEIAENPYPNVKIKHIRP